MLFRAFVAPFVVGVDVEEEKELKAGSPPE